MDNIHKYKDPITGEYKYKYRALNVRRQLQYDFYRNSSDIADYNCSLPDIISEHPENAQDNSNTLKKEDTNKEINFEDYEDEIIKLLYELNRKVPKNKIINNKIQLDKDLTTFEVAKRLRLDCLGEVSNKYQYLVTIFGHKFDFFNNKKTLFDISTYKNCHFRSHIHT